MLLNRPAVADAIGTVLSTGACDVDRSRWSTAMDRSVKRPRLSVRDRYRTEWRRMSEAAPVAPFDKKLAAQEGGVKLL